jgi:hypothetical protein
MITRLKAVYPDHPIYVENTKELFLVDHKSLHNGRFDLELSNIHPGEPHVYITNENDVPIYFDAFPDNAFQNPDGSNCRQCEGVMFPQLCTHEDWILFIEMKYAFNIMIAFSSNTNYPDNMIDQVVQTVEHLRDKGVISKEKRVSAMLAFPKLIGDFSESFFSGPRSMHDILEKYNIRIRARNTARIRSNINIKI